MMYLGKRVKVSESALKRAKAEYGTDVVATGRVVQLGDGLVTVQHDDGQEVDWEAKNLIRS